MLKVYLNCLVHLQPSTDSKLITEGLKAFHSLSLTPVSDETLTSNAKYAFLDSDSLSTRYRRILACIQNLGLNPLFPESDKLLLELTIQRVPAYWAITSESKRKETVRYRALEANFSKGGEKRSDLVADGFRFVSDWSRCEFSRPITERSEGKPKKSRLLLTLDLNCSQPIGIQS